MKYMVDFHGVVDRKPDFFRTFLGDLVKSNNTVYICSGAKESVVKNKLSKFKIKEGEHYYKILSLTDYFENNLPENEIEYDFKGNIWVDDTIWWSQKGKFCKDYNIDVIIDDSEEYFLYVPDRVLKLNVIK